MRSSASRNQDGQEGQEKAKTVSALSTPEDRDEWTPPASPKASPGTPRRRGSSRRGARRSPPPGRLPISRAESSAEPPGDAPLGRQPVRQPSVDMRNTSFLGSVAPTRFRGIGEFHPCPTALPQSRGRVVGRPTGKLRTSRRVRVFRIGMRAGRRSKLVSTPIIGSCERVMPFLAWQKARPFRPPGASIARAGVRRVER